MKTNQIVIRTMGDLKVAQRTKDGFFNATELLKQWNNAGVGNQKEVKHYFENKSTIEYINALMLEENLHGKNSAYVSSRASRGDNAGTWMCPLLFIDFAMWLNPTFKVKVLKFVFDEMIKFRNLAGEAYPSMCRAVRSIIPEPIFREKVKDLARSLNIIVYGKHELDMRNKIGDEAKIREMYELERRIAQWVNLGLVRDYKQLQKALNNLYYQKYPNILPI